MVRFFFFKQAVPWDVWVAQLVKGLTLDFSSVLDLRVQNPCWASATEPARCPKLLFFFFLKV